MTEGTTADVLAGKAGWACVAADALEFLRGLPDRCVSLVLFSPPYEAQRTYSVGYKITGQDWVDWMRPICVEACRVSAGLAVVNAAGPVRDRSYSPSLEWLVADLTRLDGLACGPSPWCWWKVCGIPGSGSSHYQRRDWEPLYAFARPDRLPLAWSDNTAFGHPPKWNPGGDFSHRTKDGLRVNDPWGKRDRGNNLGGRKKSGEVLKGTRHTKRMKGVSHKTGSTLEVQHYVPPPVANPGNVIRDESEPASDVIEARVGGGHIGHPTAHDSEAPMALAVAERFVCWYAAPGSVVCDPFAGSGTTCHAAVEHGRRFVGCDLRQSQVNLVRRRMSSVTPGMFPDAA